MDSALIRLLRADEIECRIATISEKGLSLLLFKDARVDQKILDETFTPMGWRRTHQEIGGNLYCTVEIWDESKQQWIAKQDVGTESYSEKEKGQASDSFKRACFNWGIGRELYTAPFIWIPAGKVEIGRNGGKFSCYEHFAVSKIGYDENRVINSLTIVGSKQQVLFTLYPEKTETVSKTTTAKTGKRSGNSQKMAKDMDSVLNSELKSEISSHEERVPETNPEKTPNKTIAMKGLSLAQTAELERELKRTGVSIQTVLDRYSLSSTDQMTEEIYEGAMRALRRTSSKNQRANQKAA